MDQLPQHVRNVLKLKSFISLWVDSLREGLVRT